MSDENRAPASATAVDEKRAHAWLDKWQVGECDGANLGGPLLTLLEEVRADERRRASDPAAWGCVHGYTMPHADTLCPHCCPLAWRSGTTYSRDEHVAALEALEFSTRMATIEECARVAEATQGGADSYRDMRDRIVRALRALRRVEP